MTNTNQILPFGTGAGSNVESPALWAGETVRLTGFEAGIASSRLMNTALRQASFVSAMVAQFTADYGPSNVNDDGNLPVFESQFVAALTAAVSAIAGHGIYWGADSGSPNVLVVTASPPLPGYAGGVVVITIPAYTNTGSSSLNVNGHGAINIVREDGAELAAGDIVAGKITIFIDDGAQFRVYSRGVTSNIVHSGTDTSVTANTIVSTATPAITSYVQGAQYNLLVANTNTGSAVAVLNGLASRVICRQDGSNVVAGDILAGEELCVVDNGTKLQLIGLGRSEVPRFVLNPVLYVRTDGSDLNDGSANTSSKAFATIAAAINAGITKFSLAGTSLTIQLGNPGTYASPGTIPTAVGTLNLIGDAGAQDSYIISGPGGDGLASLIASRVVLNITGVQIRNTGTSLSNHTFAAIAGSSVILDHVTLNNAGTGSNTASQAYAGGSNLSIANVLKIMGAGMGSVLASNGGGVFGLPSSAIVQINDSPTFSVGTAYSFSNGSIICLPGSAVIGAATGKRFISVLNGIIDTGGAGINFFPGTVAGVTQNGGQYA